MAVAASSPFEATPHLEDRLISGALPEPPPDEMDLTAEILGRPAAASSAAGTQITPEAETTANWWEQPTDKDDVSGVPASRPKWLQPRTVPPDNEMIEETIAEPIEPTADAGTGIRPIADIRRLLGRIRWRGTNPSADTGNRLRWPRWAVDHIFLAAAGGIIGVVLLVGVFIAFTGRRDGNPPPSWLQHQRLPRVKMTPSGRAPQ